MDAEVIATAGYVGWVPRCDGGKVCDEVPAVMMCIRGEARYVRTYCMHVSSAGR